MANHVTKDELQTALNKQTDEIIGVFQGFMVQTDERFNKLEARMDDFDRKLDKLTNTIDGFLKRLDDIETEQIARDRQFERLVAWAHKVSEKTGVPLENL